MGGTGRFKFKFMFKYMLARGGWRYGHGIS
jgi:hypothetical protein